MRFLSLFSGIEAASTVRCSLCGSQKSYAEMGKSANGKNGLHSWCRDCLRARRRTGRKDDPVARAQWSRWTRYRITEIEYQKLLTESGGLCSICKKPMQRVCVDHDHSTGLVRGLLCHSCNIKLHALDTWVFLPSALAYLKQHGAGESVWTTTTK